MSEIIEVLFHAVVAILELIFHSIVYAVRILMFLSSKKHRQKLKDEWKENKKNKVFIVTAITIIVFAGYIIISFLTLQ